MTTLRNHSFTVKLHPITPSWSQLIYIALNLLWI